jgi:hypothetical protein
MNMLKFDPTLACYIAAKMTLTSPHRLWIDNFHLLQNRYSIQQKWVGNSRVAWAVIMDKPLNQVRESNVLENNTKNRS